MKKILALVLCLVTVLTFFGCQKKPDFPESGKLTVPKIDKSIYSSMQVEYISYQNAKELVDAASLVFIGEITGIDFKVVDTRTLLPATEETDKDYLMLYTFYQVAVTTPYKGDMGDTVEFCVMGGNPVYGFEKQNRLVKEFWNDNRLIPTGERSYKAHGEIGKSYLFALSQNGKNPPEILNFDQSVFSVEEPTRKNTLTDDGKVYYTGTETESGSPLISAYDIIGEFGQKAIREFNEAYLEGKYTKS